MFEVIAQAKNIQTSFVSVYVVGFLGYDLVNFQF